MDLSDGRREMADAAPSELRKAFDTWQEAQCQALELMLSAPQPGTPTDWAEGFRWLTRMATLALEHVVEKGDPGFPVLFRSQDPYRKLIGDNPDVNYYFASLDPSQNYRLYGTRGAAAYVGLTFGTDIFRGRNQAVTGTLVQSDLDQFELGENGEFEVFMGPKAGKGNWIELEEGVAHLAVRETFVDRRDTEPAELHIERVRPGQPPPLSPEVMAESLEAASTFLIWIVRGCLGAFAASANRINAIEGGSGAAAVKKRDEAISTHSDTGMAYMVGRWRLEPGEALVVDILPPLGDFAYWGLVITNPWLESYDYRYTQTHLSNGTARANDDGSWTLVISPEEPGPGHVHNWLDTGGRLEGYAILRWVLVRDAPNPKCEVVPIESLRT
ncbi:MAG: hypothetical protein CL938_06590 [Deltaproteobacteria bacterium]|nr:hypothetical protein [Deltaproteobacteria bacterium]